MTAEQVAHLFLTEDRVIVVLLDGRAGFLLRSPLPESKEAMVQIPGEEEITYVPLADLAATECLSVITQANQWGGLGAWPAYRRKYRVGD